MNARNCQLCGKPLSRLRVGGDGDFCSKDHRNQFRLRAGMDRLVEVNKVASLMRRRESARHIPAASLMRPGATERQDMAVAFPQHMDRAPQLVRLNPAAATRPRITAHSGRYLEHAAAAAMAKAGTPRGHERQFAIISGGRLQPHMELRRQAAPVALSAPGPCRLVPTATDVADLPQDFVKLPPDAVRTYLGEGPRTLRRTGRTWVSEAARSQELKTEPARGNALRVSIGLGFRIPQLKQQGTRLDPHLTNTLSAPAGLRTPGSAGSDTGAAVRMLAVAMAEFAAKLPAARAAVRTGSFAACQALGLNGRMLRDMPVGDPLQEAVNWTAGAPRLRTARISQSAAGLARRNGAHLSALRLRPQHLTAKPQEGSSPFVAREDLCVPAVPYCNVLASASTVDGAETEPEAVGPAALTVATKAAEAVRFEENFDAGWDNWVGGVADWKVDIAGVRTGSLALYLPSLELSDYEVEFLARIDTRSVNWVVRAAGADSHMLCTVTAMQGGQLEFSRALVEGGTAETAVRSATLVPGRPHKTFTVRMSVTGPVFSITIDGKTIDTWVDDRLATGGIGFMGAADDRARLYWLRVSSQSASSKEHKLQ